MVSLPGVGFGESDELSNGLGRNQWIHHHDEGIAHDANHGRDFADKIEVELVVERRINRIE
jgi:hypothetical protein